MKILHLDTERSWRGGQGQVLNLNRELSRAGIATHLVARSGGELLRRALAEGLSAEGLALRGEWDLCSAWRLSRLLKNGGFTHLHLHSSHAQGIGVIAAMMAGFENVVATRRVDFPIKRKFFNRVKYGPRIARFVAISKVIRGLLADCGVPPDKIRLVHSGVDTEKTKAGSGAAFRREFGLGDGEILVGNIAHLAHHKGQIHLVEAIPAVLKAHPKVKFAIVGNGELMGELQNRAAALGLGENLIFTGFRKDVDAIMDALDIFVMPSVMEGLGTIVADALAAKKPVVVTDAGGIPEIVDDGVDGLVVPAGDPAALAGGIIRLLGDGKLREKLACSGRAKALAKFSAKAMMEGNLAVYRELSR
ncbi:glycosyltransferase family 4 protein [bacterium]|nr:MAG: glycosyltransferase family 4 protein [bacterium]